MSRRARQFAPAREAKHAAAWSPPVENDGGDEPGEVSAPAIPYAGPWCCAEGKRLAVPVRPECTAVSAAYREAMGVFRG